MTAEAVGTSADMSEGALRDEQELGQTLEEPNQGQRKRLAQTPVKSGGKSSAKQTKAGMRRLS